MQQQLCRGIPFIEYEGIFLLRNLIFISEIERSFISDLFANIKKRAMYED